MPQCEFQFQYWQEWLLTTPSMKGQPSPGHCNHSKKSLWKTSSAILQTCLKFKYWRYSFYFSGITVLHKRITSFTLQPSLSRYSMLKTTFKVPTSLRRTGWMKKCWKSGTEFPSLIPKPLKNAKVDIWKELKTAWHLVNTRGVSVAGEIVLIPYLDLLNHSPLVQVTVTPLIVTPPPWSAKLTSVLMVDINYGKISSYRKMNIKVRKSSVLKKKR